MKRQAAQWFRTGILTTVALALAGSLPAQQEQTAPVPPTAPAQTLGAQQLDDLVAPIALYPDPLLGQVLAAATYPVELVEAQQWLKTVSLNGQALTDAAKQQDWDPSVQALVAMPDVMNLLTEDIRWTTDLGNAFLAQQADVMGAVQRMRQRAQANGHLKTNEQETVTTNYDNGQSAIEIVPTNPQVIYVPYYDPYYVWGYSSYPSLYYPDGYWFGSGINIGFYFGGWSGWTYGGWGWGWRPNWFAHNIYINHGFFDRYNYHYRGFGGGHNVWAHDPGHRWGARYPSSVSNRFGGAARAARMNEGRSGNWHRFNGGGNGSNGFRGTANGFNGSRSNGSNGSRVNGSNGLRGGNNGNSFRGSGTPQQRAGARAQSLGGQSIRSQAPQRNLQSTPQRNFRSAPQRNLQSTPRTAAPRMSAPQRNFQSAPRTAAPRISAPRAAAPRMSAPQRNFQSAPRAAAPRMSAPRASSPRMSAPAAHRSMGGGGGVRSSGGGGGARVGGGGSPGGGGARVGGHGRR